MTYSANTRVRLVSNLHVFNLGSFPKGATGTVVLEPHYEGLSGIVKMDDHFDDLNEWDNELQICDDGEVTWDAFEVIP